MFYPQRVGGKIKVSVTLHTCVALAQEQLGGDFGEPELWDFVKNVIEGLE